MFHSFPPIYVPPVPPMPRKSSTPSEPFGIALFCFLMALAGITCLMALWILYMMLFQGDINSTWVAQRLQEQEAQARVTALVACMHMQAPACPNNWESNGYRCCELEGYH